MALTPGGRLGPYEISAQIGAGGMGEVYRARDTKLGREIAIKVLPAALTNDADRLARFAREAQVLAALNHPNIASIHHLEETPEGPALVMELVEGETLADRIARGPIPIDEALTTARQIAEALEAAHERGIIHRDLKPANVKVRPDGTVKVLDFGLAKLAEPGSGIRDQQSDTTKNAPSMSPTITSPALMTGVGVLLGTAAYMAPEQAKGKPADKRSDVWAFGCVLYEMLTGKRAFAGDDVSETLASVLAREPDWTALPTTVAPTIRTLLRRCLDKDRRKRVADISTAGFAIDEVGTLTTSSASSLGIAISQVALWRRLLVYGAPALVAGLAIAGAGVWFATRPAPLHVSRFAITTTPESALTISSTDRDVAITPDGSRVVYRGDNQLLVRALDQLQPTILTGLGAPHGVFVSPDGQWVGFFDGNAAIKKVSITGGPGEIVCAIGEGVPGGATWGPDGTVIFATFATARGLQRVAATGGEPTAITKVDRARGETNHLWPEFLPGRKAVLFTITTGLGPSVESGQIAVLDLESNRSKILIRGGSHAHYAPSGHLVYGVPGALRAVPFDLQRLEVVGTPAPVLDGVVTTVLGAADMALAANGSLVYVAGGVIGGGPQTVVWVDRQGRPSPLPGLPPDRYRTVRVSPDGTKVALATFEQVSIYELARATVIRLTTGPTHDSNPLWTPDGQRIVFTSLRAGYPELFVRRADGSGDVERLFGRSRNLIDLLPNNWSRDGTQLLFTEVQPNIQCTIAQVTVGRPSDATMLVKNDFCNSFAALSPDGRWIAYSRFQESGWEIYVERYPELGNRQQISAGGGDIAVWSRDGRELFFKSPDGRRMFAVPIQLGTTLVAGRPQMLFEAAMPPSGGGVRAYDIDPDGRFLIIRSATPEASPITAPQIIVVQNWDQELKRLVPTK